MHLLMHARIQERKKQDGPWSIQNLSLPEGGSGAVTLSPTSVDIDFIKGFSNSTVHTHQIPFTKPNIWNKTWQGKPNSDLLSTTHLRRRWDLSLCSGITVSVTGKPCPVGRQGERKALWCRNYPFVQPLTLFSNHAQRFSFVWVRVLMYPGTMVSDERSTGTSVPRSIFNSVCPCVLFQRNIGFSVLLCVGRGLMGERTSSL